MFWLSGVGHPCRAWPSVRLGFQRLVGPPLHQYDSYETLTGSQLKGLLFSSLFVDSQL